MDYAEEQRNELEALASIYFDEFEDLDTDPPSFVIQITPEGVDDDGESVDEDQHGKTKASTTDNNNTIKACIPLYSDFNLKISYTPTYPETIPSIEILDAQNMSDIELETLHSRALEECTTNLGMAMIFTVVSALKDSLDDIMSRRKEILEQAAEKERERIEAEDQKKYQGTKVTMETFSAWRRKFMIEMALLDEKEFAKLKAMDPKFLKPTGKQLFTKDKSLATSDMQFRSGEDEVEVDMGLFEGIEGLDLSDDEDMALLFEDDDD